MNEISTHSGRIVYACATIYVNKWLFITLSVIVFLITTILLAMAGIIPDNSPPARLRSASIAPVVTVAPVSVTSSLVASQRPYENPIRIVMSSIHKSASVENPNTENVRILDKALLSGAVRYWRSAKLGEAGNIVLFGHSSYLPGIYNPAYKTFTGIQNFRKGARILVYSSTTVYEYAVYTVKKQNTTTDAVNLLVHGRELTLITCNVFGKKSDRFVVTAHFVKSYPIRNNS